MNYDDYFLEYLNQAQQKVTYYDPRNSNCPDFMNRIIESLINVWGKLYLQMSEARHITTPVIHCKCIDDHMINAFCFWHPEQNFYGVAVTSATYIKLYEQLSAFAHDPYLKGVTYLNSISPDDLTNHLFVYALQFIAKHEYMHIILGHCRLIQNRGSTLYLEEHSTTGEKQEPNLYSQAMERIADYYAISDSIGQLLTLSNYNIEKIKTNLLIYYLSILHIFSLFYAGEHYDWDSPYILDKLQSTDHPSTGMRFHYIAEAIDGTLLNHYKKEGEEKAKNIVDNIDHIMDIIFDISRQFHDLFRIELIFPLYEPPGMRYNVRLFNAMPPVISDCERFALFHPINYTPVDEDISVQQMCAIEQQLLQE